VGHTVDSQRDLTSHISKRDINGYRSGCSINNLRAREGGLHNVSLKREDMEKEVSHPISFPQDVLCDLATSIPGLLNYTNSSWDCTAAISDGAYCFWRGVTCDSANAITGISISNTFEGAANLSTIPSSISSLSSLQILSIKSCGLQGTIPFSLSELSYLRSLVLSSNILQGAIPDSLSALTNLQTLYINNNSFIGTLPASVMSMSSLLYLDVSLNKFVGKFPDFYGMSQNSFKRITPHLKTLKSNQRSSHSLPTIERERIMVIEMERDKSIVEIVEQMEPENRKNEKNGRKITENENENHKRLRPEKRNEYYNENDWKKEGESSETTLFNKEHPSDEMNFKEDRYLKSVQTYYSPDYDVPISTSSTPYTSSVGLRFLSLYANFLTGTIPSSISLMTSLIGFHVSYNSFTGTIPSSLGNILSLKYLSLQWNSLNGTIPHTIGRLSNLNSLKLFTNRYFNKLYVNYSV
jgi:Leucine rich repeat